MNRGLILVDSDHVQITTCPDNDFASRRIHIYFKHAEVPFPECWSQATALDLFRALGMHFESQERAP